MSEVATNGPYTFSVPVGTAVSKYQLVKIDANGDLSAAGSTDDVIGICQSDVPSAAADRVRGDTAGVVPVTHSGVVRLIAASAISVGDPLFKAAGGKVDDTGTEAIGFVCITPNIAADGDVLEAIPFV